jgi:hypothetical protein
MKLTFHIHLVPRSKHAWKYTSTPPIRPHGVVLSSAQGQLYLYLPVSKIVKMKAINFFTNQLYDKLNKHLGTLDFSDSGNLNSLRYKLFRFSEYEKFVPFHYAVSENLAN